MKLLLDLDGCVFDFIGGIARLLGRSVPDPYPPGEWGFESAFGVDSKLMWKTIDAAGPNFWAGLEFMHDAETLIGVVNEFFKPEDVFICTSASHSPNAMIGKMQAIKRLPWDQIIMTPHKHMCRGLLLDDYDVNIDRHWDSSQPAIMMPRPWNRMYDYVDPMTWVELKFNHLSDCGII